MRRALVSALSVRFVDFEKGPLRELEEQDVSSGQHPALRSLQDSVQDMPLVQVHVVSSKPRILEHATSPCSIFVEALCQVHPPHMYILRYITVYIYIYK